MKIRAVGRQLLVRLDFDLIDAIKEKSLIQLPEETIDRMKGGVQISTILHVGESAFDDEPPSVRDTIVAGRQVLTGRYPGHAIDFDPLASDAQMQVIRLINSSEVHGLVALDDEEGADV